MANGQPCSDSQLRTLTDALETLAAHNYRQAETLLRQVQLWAEERYLEEEPTP